MWNAKLIRNHINVWTKERDSKRQRIRCAYSPTKMRLAWKSIIEFIRTIYKYNRFWSPISPTWHMFLHVFACVRIRTLTLLCICKWTLYSFHFCTYTFSWYGSFFFWSLRFVYFDLSTVFSMLKDVKSPIIWNNHTAVRIGWKCYENVRC